MKSIGDKAEEFVEEFVKTKQNWKILDRNWRRPGSEIDIVATEKISPKQNQLHFIEVKYRSGNTSAIFESISTKKLFFMKRAATHWQLDNRSEMSYQLDVAFVQSSPSGNFKLDFRENITG